MRHMPVSDAKCAYLPCGQQGQSGKQEVPVLLGTLEMAFRTRRSWGQRQGQPTRVPSGTQNQKKSRTDEKEVRISRPNEVMIPLSSVQI